MIIYATIYDHGRQVVRLTAQYVHLAKTGVFINGQRYDFDQLFINAQAAWAAWSRGHVATADRVTPKMLADFTPA